MTHTAPVHVWLPDSPTPVIAGEFTHDSVGPVAVSYTHLDVYKRQGLCRCRESGQRFLRFSLPRPCRHGADELRRTAQGRRLRSVEWSAVADRRSGPALSLIHI